MKLPSFPIEIRNGASVATIYRQKSDERERFVLAYYAEGVRKRETFSDYARAKTRAWEITGSVRDGNLEGLALSRDDLILYRRACDLLRPLKIDLYRAVSEYAESRQVVGPSFSLIEAARHFARSNPWQLKAATVPELVKKMIEEKRADGASEVYLKDLDIRLTRFADGFNLTVSEVRIDDVNEWLRGLDAGGRSRNNYRSAIRTLFRYAESGGYIGEGSFPLKKLARAKEDSFDIEIFTPEEMVKLLRAAKLSGGPGVNRRYIDGKSLLPLLLLGGFAGLRTAEFTRQMGEDVNLERGFIRVTGVKGNTESKRLVPIAENLRAWLQECPLPKGLVCTHNRPIDALERLAKRAGVEWKHNALRHSFISYRIAELKNVPQVALEAGNSPRMVNRHYRELVTPDQARAWFSIMPMTALTTISI